ncbi:MAG: transposase [Clostridia bacterium]|nr:transposase [Clostridia bacterium]
MELPKRKPTRLKDYDYSQNGYYFITICTKEKQKILCNIVGDDAHIVPKEYGQTVEKYLCSENQIEKYVIMPNHIHMIIKIDSGTMWASSPTKSVSNIIRSFKTLVTKEIGKPIFQRSFHDHIIRGEQDYKEIWSYIDSNPMRWKEDKFYNE